ncbi:MAG: hypothetical protein JOY77_06830, partial [Alphaproteobacteria bacterium]|nr:hypothetical protein [Alphaproteobacteria bacterium]
MCTPWGAKFLTQKGVFCRGMTHSLHLSRGIALVVAAMVLLAGNAAPAQRIAFVIATGPTGGTYFPVGEAIASIVSHPPGVYRCETPGVCGPPG